MRVVVRGSVNEFPILVRLVSPGNSPPPARNSESCLGSCGCVKVLFFSLTVSAFVMTGSFKSYSVCVHLPMFIYRFALEEETDKVMF